MWLASIPKTILTPTILDSHHLNRDSLTKKNTISRPKQITVTPKFLETEKVKSNEKVEDLLPIKWTR